MLESMQEANARGSRCSPALSETTQRAPSQSSSKTQTPESGSPLQTYYKAVREQSVNVIGSESARAEAAPAASATKSSIVVRKDDQFDRTLRILDHARGLSLEKTKKKSWEVLSTVWTWVVSIREHLNIWQISSIAMGLWIFGPKLSPLAKTAMAQLMSKLLAMVYRRLIRASVAVKLRLLRTLAAFFDTSPSQMEVIFSSARAL